MFQDCFTVYIFQSLLDGSFYIGHTDNLDNRILRHLHGYVRSTRNKRPLALVWTERYPSRSLARYREWELKHSAWKRKKLFKKICLKK